MVKRKKIKPIRLAPIAFEYYTTLKWDHLKMIYDKNGLMKGSSWWINCHPESKK